MRHVIMIAAILIFGAITDGFGQDQGSLNPQPLPPLANPNDPTIPAKELFGRKSEPVPLAARSIGTYARGCLAGAVALPVNGKTWQVMRLSRDRNWGHPDLIHFLEQFAGQVPKAAGWPGILVGDISQPRGGPMLTGHASHQLGLDADIWLTPMPDHELNREQRETMSAINVVAADGKDVDHTLWTPQHTAVIRAAAQTPQVERIFVNSAIKKELCREAGPDRTWLSKVRPWWGHNYHFHVRIHCPAHDPDCHGQDPVPAGDGCNDLAWWFSDAVLHPPPPEKPAKPRPPMTLADLPTACRQVLMAP